MPTLATNIFFFLPTNIACQAHHPKYGSENSKEKDPIREKIAMLQHSGLVINREICRYWIYFPPSCHLFVSMKNDLHERKEQSCQHPNIYHLHIGCAWQTLRYANEAEKNKILSHVDIYQIRPN